MGNQSKLVSIILPTYNGAEYLGKAIESCLIQSYKNIELIIVIDGSTDETRSVISMFYDDRIQVIDNETNRGLPASLNIGLRASRGEYLTWTSDDNYYHPQAIARMVDALSNARQSAFEMVYAGCEMIDADDKKVGSFIPGNAEECIIGGNFIYACFLFSRKMYEEIGEYDVNLQGIEDYDYWIRARKKFKFMTLKEILYSYRQHDGSLTARYMGKMAAMFEELCERHYVLWNFNKLNKHKDTNTKLVGFGLNLDDINADIYVVLQDELLNGQYLAFTPVRNFPIISQDGKAPAFPAYDVIKDSSKLKILVTTDAVAELIGADFSMTAQDVANLININGGKLGCTPLFCTGQDKPQSVIEWFEFGKTMNDVDKYSVSRLLAYIVKQSMYSRKRKNEIAYFTGMLAAKVHNFPKHIVRPRVEKLLRQITR